MAASDLSPHDCDAGDVPGVVAHSPAMQELCRMIRRVADSQASLLLWGEPGVGTAEIAAAIHRLSGRRGPLVKTACGSPAAALASDWFGSQPPEPGSKQPAVRHPGRFIEADEGTIFLDQVERTPMALQAPLLQILQEHRVPAAWQPQPVAVDVRVIAASGPELAAEVDAGRFRADLYWRLNVVSLEIPPLRNRLEDVPQLVDQFVEASNQRHQRRVRRVSTEAMNVLLAYAWPGNLYELQSYIERAVVLAEREELTIDVLPATVSGLTPLRQGGLSRFDLGSLTEEVVAQGIAAVPADDPHPGLHGKIVDSVERELIRQVLRGCNGVRKQAATQLGINRNTLLKKIKQYELDTESPETAGEP